MKLKIKVPFEFSIHFTRGVFSKDNPLFKEIIASAEKNRRHRILFVIEDKLAAHYPLIASEITEYCANNCGLMLLTRPPVFKTGGENLKSFDVIEDFCALINESRLCRQSFICIIGGGAFLDAAGFAASIVHRGVRQIRFPTTVLAQCDSGVGVKNGLNMFGKKNFIGTFAPPFAVVNDFNFLGTLEQRDWISGIAEAFKVSLIKDAPFFQWLCANAAALAGRDSKLMEKLVVRCAKIHINHIQKNGDPFEFGSARPLDFGHWAAHKLEMLSRGRLRHGEAVAIGIMLDLFYAWKLGLVEKTVVDETAKAFSTLGFKLWSPYLDKKDSMGRPLILSGVEDFREHLGGELHITLPNGLGGKIEVNELNEEIILKAIKYLSKFSWCNSEPEFFLRHPINIPHGL